MPGIIDIGSNSIRLLLDGRKYISTTRLSERLTATGRLSGQAMSRTLDALCGFVNMTAAAGQTAFAFGTEPLRAATNADEFIRQARERTGVEIDVLSGKQECELALIGGSRGNGGTVIDIGGASVEMVCGNRGNIKYEKSQPCGMVRLVETYGKGDSNALREAITKAVQGYGNPPQAEYAYGIGGTFTSLAAMANGLEKYNPEIVDRTRITRKVAEGLAERLSALNGDISGITAAYPVLSHSRAELITAGALFTLALITHLNLEYIEVSESDNLEGYLIYKNL